MKKPFSHTSEIIHKASMPARFATARHLIPLAVVAALITPLSVAIAQSVSDSSKTDQTPKGDAQNGRRLFARDGCYECHGREAQGAGLNGPHLVPDPIPIEAFLIFVRHPGGEMPPYTAKVVSDKELIDIYAFLASQPQPPPVSSIPILKH